MELIVVMAILGVIGLVTIQYIFSASELYVSILSQRQADTEIRGALNRMTREFRTFQTPLTADVHTLTFTNSYGRTNTFALQGDTVVLNGNPLACGADVFAFTYYDMTNNPLLPLPLGSTNRTRVRRVALALQVTREHQAARIDVNYFGAVPGILK